MLQQNNKSLKLVRKNFPIPVLSEKVFAYRGGAYKIDLINSDSFMVRLINEKNNLPFNMQLQGEIMEGLLNFIENEYPEILV